MSRAAVRFVMLGLGAVLGACVPDKPQPQALVPSAEPPARVDTSKFSELPFTFGWAKIANIFCPPVARIGVPWNS